MLHAGPERVLLLPNFSQENNENQKEEVSRPRSHSCSGHQPQVSHPQVWVLLSRDQKRGKELTEAAAASSRCLQVGWSLPGLLPQINSLDLIRLFDLTSGAAGILVHGHCTVGP